MPIDAHCVDGVEIHGKQTQRRSRERKKICVLFQGIGGWVALSFALTFAISCTHFPCFLPFRPFGVSIILAFLFTPFFPFALCLFFGGVASVRAGLGFLLASCVCALGGARTLLPYPYNASLFDDLKNLERGRRSF